VARRLVQALVNAGYRGRPLRQPGRRPVAALRPTRLPNLLLEALKLRFGMKLRTPYTLHDMAADAWACSTRLRSARARRRRQHGRHGRAARGAGGAERC
jgi:hypothetical protein